MTGGSEIRAGRSSRGRVYVWVADPQVEAGGRVVESVVPLERLDPAGPGADRLWGRHVRVRNAAVIHEPGDAPGAVIARTLGDARPDAHGDFLFDPRRGGARLDKYILRSEKYRERYVDAARFGEVNAYFHVDRIAEHVNALLAELGAPPLPRVTVVVNAHHAAVPLASGARDGVLMFDRWVPFQGGHYRLPNRRYGVAELEPISPEGEIHLGPGWKLLEHGALVDAAGGRYRHIASHNAGTIYHEYGHHVARHTADFRANALRASNRQSNVKTALDEGFCDYWAGAMLGTPHIWCWHHRHDRNERHDRSLHSTVTMAQFDAGRLADPHDNGTIWAAALWELRTHMALARPDGARDCDRLVLQALLLIGREVGVSQPVTVRQVRRARRGYGGALRALLRAEERLYGGEFRDAIVQVFGARGIRPDEPTPAVTNGSAGRAEASRRTQPGISPRVRHTRQLHSGWEETPRSLAELDRARNRLVQHVPAEDIPATDELFGRGELGARLRELREPPVSVLMTGDTMLGERSQDVIAQRGLEYPFKALRPLLRRAFIVLGNLEGPIAAGGESQERTYSYRVDPRMAVALKRAGFRIMNLANNHLTDCGRRGVVETIEVLTRAGIAPLGAGIDETSAHAPVILEARDLRIGFLGYYWNRRTAARRGLPGSAMDPPADLERDIRRLRAHADRVVVTFHWGVPYVREPAAEDRAKARFAVDCGADAVIGHHVHVMQPFEIWRGKPIFYGIGNCAFGSGNSKGEGLVVGLSFEAARTRVSVYPLYVKNRDPRVAYQPKVLRGAAARHYLGRLAALSGSDGHRLVIEDFRGVLDLPWAPEADEAVAPEPN